MSSWARIQSSRSMSMPISAQITRIDSRDDISTATSTVPVPLATTSLTVSTVSRRITGSRVRTALFLNQGSTTPRSTSWRPGSPLRVNGSTIHMNSMAM